MDLVGIVTSLVSLLFCNSLVSLCFIRISFDTFGSLSESERLAQELNNIKYLKLLRTIVHNEIKHTDPMLREEGNNPQEFRR